MSTVVAMKLRREEEHVRAVLSQHLGVPVEPHDDGSIQSMWDLTIRYPDRSAAPVEVTSDVSGEMLRTLNELEKNDGGGYLPSSILSRVWLLTTLPNVNMRRLRPNVEQHLKVLESGRACHFHASMVRSRQIGAFMAKTPLPTDLGAQTALMSLGVISADSYLPSDDSDRPGVRLAIQGGGGTWGGSAESVVSWIEAFTTSTRRRDNLDKLTDAAAVAGEAHLAVFADVHQVDFAVWRSIEDRDESGVIPTRAPALPAPLTHVWLFASPGGSTGLAWSINNGWSRFLCTL